MNKQSSDKINNTLFGKMQRSLFSYLKVLDNLKKKKIYGIRFFSRRDFKYQKEIRKSRLTKKKIEAMEKKIDSFAFKPKISVIMPVYNVEQEWLEDALESVLNQVYRNWELCIVDDASSAPHIKNVLTRYQCSNERIIVKYLEKNRGISGSSNEALSFATGQYVAFLDHDDRLSKESLYEVVKLLNRHPETEIIYTDEDKLSMGGMRLRPVYKPGWDPELFLTYNYFCHLVVCSRKLVSKAGGFRRGFEGSQDYDLLLRLTELSDKIFHIPKILYHWRMIPGSAASEVDAKAKSFELAKIALRDAMERRGIRAVVSNGDSIGTFRVKQIKNGK